MALSLESLPLSSVNRRTLLGIGLAALAVQSASRISLSLATISHFLVADQERHNRRRNLPESLAFPSQ